MASSAITFCKSQSASGTFMGNQPFVGGRGVLVISASTMPTAANLQVFNFDGVAANVNSAAITASGVFAYDLPAGLYQFVMSGGSPSNVSAQIITIPYP